MDNQTVAALANGENPNIVVNNTGVDMGVLIEEYKTSKTYVEQYTNDFPQLDTLVDAIPLNYDNDTPFVGDTTLGGLVRSIPRDSLQQLPVFSAVVNGSKKTVPSLVCTFLLKKFAFNEDTFGKGLLSTLQIGAEQALTRGYAPFMVATGVMYKDFGTTLRLLHYSDTSPEPGITDHNETGYDYVTAHLTASRVRRILKNAEANENTSWNVPALRQVLENAPKPTDYSKKQSPSEQNSAGEAASPSYEFVTRYPVGVTDEELVTFFPEMAEAPLRTIEPRSKWGYSRVMYLVIDPAALMPFGKSRVRLASPNVNLMNIYYGNIAAMLLLNSKPPILKRGRFTTPVQLKMGAVWETLDQNATADLKNLDNGSLQFFPQMAQQFAGQIQNIMGGKTMTINAGSKSGFGKTAPGEKRAQAFEDSSSNQITKILENFLRQYALVALDTLFAEQEGTDQIIVDDETKEAINTLKPGFIGDDNKFEMDWQAFYDAIEEWSVDIDVSLSKDELDEKKRADLQDMAVVVGQNLDKLPPEFQQKFGGLVEGLMRDKAPLIGAAPATPVAPTAPAPGTPPAMAPPAAPTVPAGV